LHHLCQLQFGKTLLFHIEDAFKQMKNPCFSGWSPMFHWTDSKIRVHAFYCVLALLLTSLLHRELSQNGEELSINRMLEELGGIRETLLVYPRRQGQHQSPTAACLTRTNDRQRRIFSLLELQQYAPGTRSS
jgi:transposase